MARLHVDTIRRRALSSRLANEDTVGATHMAKEFINPNWHVILIHLPLGVFMLGMVLELALLVFRHRGGGRTASRWMVVLGALASLPAAYSGMYALSDVARRTAPMGAAGEGPWHAVAQAS